MIRIPVPVAGIVLGLVVGGALTYGGTEFVGSILYGVSAHDSATFAIAATVLGTTTLIAAGVPAWKATRIDPVECLTKQ